MLEELLRALEIGIKGGLVLVGLMATLIAAVMILSIIVNGIRMFRGDKKDEP